jgi:two-component system, sensor histidine kinase and response regulator
MDLQMPVMDGLEATAASRKLEVPSKARVSIIALTAHAMRGDENRYLTAGMGSYINKAVTPGELFMLVERLAGSPDTPAGDHEAAKPPKEAH